MSTTTTAAASVAGLPQLELEGLPEITQYMLECNYPKLERIARRQRRVKSLSQGNHQTLSLSLQCHSDGALFHG